MAHMWFGDLVTMRWWDDLWLNESFAEYLGNRVAAEATRFTEAWTTFAMQRKAWGLRADQRPSTHPVAPATVADTGQALLNFDGISYAKGASVLRQLVAWVGDEAFLAGLNEHFAAHAYGNATLADLLGALSEASGRDLTAWAEVWLRRAQVNTLRAEVAPATGRTTPRSRSCRPRRRSTQRCGRTGSASGCSTGSRTGRWSGASAIEVDVDPATDGGRTAVAALTGVRAADLLLLNDGDLTYAKIRLDQDSTAAGPRVLPLIADPLTRAVLWAAALDAVVDGERPVAELVTLVLAALPIESEVVIVEDMLRAPAAWSTGTRPPAARPARCSWSPRPPTACSPAPRRPVPGSSPRPAV